MLYIFILKPYIKLAILNIFLFYKISDKNNCPSVKTLDFVSMKTIISKKLKIMPLFNSYSDGFEDKHLGDAISKKYKLFNFQKQKSTRERELRYPWS